MTAQPPPRLITAQILYDQVRCPHRPAMDLFGDLAERDATNPFVELLWECGNKYEKDLIAALEVPFTDLSTFSLEEKEHRTDEAIARGDTLIYSARISADDLLGDPDLLRKEGAGYVPIDIKSGRGEEGDAESSKPKKHYAVQIATYSDILERKGISAGRRGYIWDVHGDDVLYDLKAPLSQRNQTTLWDFYQAELEKARQVVSGESNTRAAYCGECKMCHWYTSCLGTLEGQRDLSLIPELGRAKRDALANQFPEIGDLATSNLGPFIKGSKTDFPRIGADTLRTLQERAQLIVDGGEPYLRSAVQLPNSEQELFFDIEVDPMRDICYLHGFVERNNGDNNGERYVAFFAENPNARSERQAFADAWEYVQAAPGSVIYYYSKYERTIYRKLCQKYPEICSEDELEQMFDPSTAVDLYYDVVKKYTEWPTRDHSIKTLAKYLGFNWRDTHPSGAASIAWFDHWVQSGDGEIKQRILDYNEDDCRATRVLLDGIRKLSS